MADNIKERVLVVKPSSLGDIVNTFPAVSLIAGSLPDTRIDWLANEEFADIVRYHPAVSDVLPFPRRRLGSPTGFLPAALELFGNLRRGRYDLVFDFQGLMRSSLVARLTGAREVRGFADTREKLAVRLYHHAHAPDVGIRHAVERNLSLAAEYFGVAPGEVQPEMPVNAVAAAAVAAKLGGFAARAGQFLVGIVPGARWRSKQWPPEFFAAVVGGIAAAVPAAEFVAIGGRGDTEAAAAIAGRVGEVKYASLAGDTNLLEMVEALRLCSLVVTNDSGPMHVAAALGVPTVALFGATDPARTGPFGANSAFLQAEVPCAKCYKRQCPLALCHQSIKPEKAVEAALALLFP